MNSRALLLLLAVNACAVLAGAYYYRAQLLSTPFFLWPFVPDSPFPPLLALLSLTAFLSSRKQWPVLDVLIAAGMLKYGVWAMMAILMYSEHFLSPSLAAWFVMLFILHAGEALQSLVFASKTRWNQSMLAIPLGILLLNDIADYFLGSLSTHPVVPVDSRISLLALLTICVSVASVFLVYAFNQSRHPFIARVRAMFTEWFVSSK